MVFTMSQNIPMAARIRQQATSRREQQRVFDTSSPSAATSLSRAAAIGGGPPSSHFIGGGGGGNNPLPHVRFSATNRLGRRDRSSDYFTQQELDDALERTKLSGKSFRKYFFIVVVLVVALITFAKWDVEMRMEVPQFESGKGFGEIKDVVIEEKRQTLEHGDTENDGETGSSNNNNNKAYQLSEEERNEVGEFLKVLGVTDGEELVNELASDAPNKESAERQRRRDLYELKKKAKAAHDVQEKKYGQLVTCGRGCQSSQKQLEIAYDGINSILPEDVYKTIFDAKDTHEKRRVYTKDLKEQYEHKKRDIETKEKNPDDKDMMLAELKDAYDVLSSPDARAYYHLYGRKAPEAMKHVNARHGGWGQEFTLGTYKHKVIFALIDYFKSSWSEMIVLGSIALLLLARLPKIIIELIEMAKILDDQEDLDQRTEQTDFSRKEK